MGIDLATLIAGMATVYSGNPLSLEPGFSIGGESSKGSNVLGNLFGLLGNKSTEQPKKLHTKNVQVLPAACLPPTTSSKPMRLTLVMICMSPGMLRL
jgi:hypothetical protein